MNNLKALVVEDSIVTQRLITIFLKRMGFDVVTIDNGREALKLLNDSHFDIIFLDVIMPEIDGYTVCKLIKSNPVTKSIPVFMLTSKDGMFDKVRGKMSGSDIYLVKPISYVALVKSVAKFYPLINGVLDIKYESPTTEKKPKRKIEMVSNSAQKIPKATTRSNPSRSNKVISLADRIKLSRLHQEKKIRGFHDQDHKF